MPKRLLAERLDAFSFQVPGTLTDLLPSIREALDVTLVAAYRPMREAGGWKIDLLGVDSARDASAFRAAAKRLARSAPPTWGSYNPLAPDPAQRNSVVKPLLEPGITGIRMRELVDTVHPEGGGDMARVLLCDGPMLLAVLLVIHDRKIPATVVKNLKTLAPSLVRRLRLERALERGSLGPGAVCAALAAVELPAFVVGDHGVIEHANDAGMLALADSSADIQKRIAIAAHGASTKEMGVAQIEGRAPRGRSVVVLRGATTARRDRTAKFAREHALTPRQLDVLREVVRGASNREIAATLACAEVTVEVHVSALLRKANVRSRAALLAKLWASA